MRHLFSYDVMSKLPAVIIPPGVARIDNMEMLAKLAETMPYVETVDEHAAQDNSDPKPTSKQPRATSPTCVSRVTWGPTQVTWIPDRPHKESHKDNRSEGSHKVRGIPQTYRDRRSAGT